MHAPPFRAHRRVFAGLCGTSLVVSIGCSSDLAEVSQVERLAGGETTNSLLLGSNAFIHPAANITPDHERLFYSGNGLFNSPWVQAPASTEKRDGLGPLFNSRSCSGCHFKDGRGRPPLEPGEGFTSMLLRIGRPGLDERGAPLPDPNYGGQLQPHAIDGVAAEGRPAITYTEIAGEYDDGEPYTLLAPTYAIHEPGYGPFAADLAISPRTAPVVIGLGLLEAIPVARLEELADPDDDDGDGIRGHLNWVWDAQLQRHAVGRFGWKAEQPSVFQQAAGAFLGDIGMTTSLFDEQNCRPAQTACAQAAEGGIPEIEDPFMERVTIYSQLLAVPVRQAWDTDDIRRGKRLFSEIGCASCHVPSHRTNPDAALAEVRDQLIWPYTDLLLHDMGDALGDGRPSYAARGNDWRTPPLWGLRLIQTVNGHDRLLHDGRARGVAEAILWHGGEALDAADGFRALSATQREDLLAFVESL